MRTSACCITQMTQCQEFDRQVWGEAVCLSVFPSLSLVCLSGDKPQEIQPWNRGWARPTDQTGNNRNPGTQQAWYPAAVGAQQCCQDFITARRLVPLAGSPNAATLVSPIIYHSNCGKLWPRCGQLKTECQEFRLDLCGFFHLAVCCFEFITMTWSSGCLAESEKGARQ